MLIKGATGCPSPVWSDLTLEVPPNFSRPWEHDSWGQHGAHLGPTWFRGGPCRPHEPCYLGPFWMTLIGSHDYQRNQAENMCNHDDVIKWKHFPRYWPFVRGFHRSPVNSPHKDQWRGALMFSLICTRICTRINGWVNNGEADDLRRYRVHYDVTVMFVAPTALADGQAPSCGDTIITKF